MQELRCLTVEYYDFNSFLADSWLSTQVYDSANVGEISEDLCTSHARCIFVVELDLNLRAKMFNRKASKPENQSEQVVESLGLKEGDCVADIGSGGGYFTMRFARRVASQGTVYAVDTDADMLDYVKDTSEKEGFSNVETVLVTPSEVDLPRKGLDFVFTRNAYHHLENPVGYFTNLKHFLKPNGRVAILEYRKAGGIFRRIFGHYVEKKQIVQDMKGAGYQLQEEFDFLPDQSFTIYSPNNE